MAYGLGRSDSGKTSPTRKPTVKQQSSANQSPPRSPVWAEASADPPLINPTTGIDGCCALAASGQVTAAPPSNVMNSRLRM
jgi:hypothetical protein